MQDYPLVVTSILDYAAKFHAEQEVITRTVEGEVHRHTYADLHRRSQLCALALCKLGVRYLLQRLAHIEFEFGRVALSADDVDLLCRAGDIVATLAWNTHRHMECWQA